MNNNLINRINRKLTKLRLQPIRVFCFHQVSDSFDDHSMYREDWLQTDVFKRLINNFRKEGYSFISILDAHHKLHRDVFRRKKYIVLTADDGWASLRNILPWLDEQKIPITLFLNPAYLDGNHYRERESEQYIREKEAKSYCSMYPLLTIGLHGWAHMDSAQQSESEFIESVERSMVYFKNTPNYIPYFAYTWGRHNKRTDDILKNLGLTPVLMNGQRNYNDPTMINRELLK